VPQASLVEGPTRVTGAGGIQRTAVRSADLDLVICAFPWVSGTHLSPEALDPARTER
jgi:hypothetical protein